MYICTVPTYLWRQLYAHTLASSILYSIIYVGTYNTQLGTFGGCLRRELRNPQLRSISLLSPVVVKSIQSRVTTYIV